MIVGVRVFLKAMGLSTYCVKPYISADINTLNPETTKRVIHEQALMFGHVLPYVTSSCPEIDTAFKLTNKKLDPVFKGEIPGITDVDTVYSIPENQLHTRLKVRRETEK